MDTILEKQKQQQGQSLIETIMAIFLLTMSLTAGLGVAIYAFSSASLSQNEIVASNLAREGFEAVRMMRDSNWLASDVKGGSWDLTSCSHIGGKMCFPKAYQNASPIGGFDLNNGNQRAIFNPNDGSWSLDNNPTNYNLYLQNNGAYTSTDNGTSSIFARMINISFNSNPPFDSHDDGEEMIVKSVVAWQGKKCAAFNSNQNLLALSTPCKVVVEEHLTNWKDYK